LDNASEDEFNDTLESSSSANAGTSNELIGDSSSELEFSFSIVLLVFFFSDFLSFPSILLIAGTIELEVELEEDTINLSLLLLDVFLE
jgi:hypothetical protein